jgi:D-glycero-D-manno-heptose 1,7-bisphosphate phosphatase
MQVLFFERRLNPRNPAIFIDRDGVINHRRAGDYVLSWSQFTFMPGIRRALKDLALLQLPIIVISNQSAVGRGLLDAAVLESITCRMHKALLSDGAPISAVYYCTHKPEDDCICRKPRPALLHKAAADFRVDLANSVFIGDSDADVRAAQLAGCKPVLFGPGLTACSDSSTWTEGLPVAAGAKELFAVVTDLLKKSVGLPVASTYLPVASAKAREDRSSTTNYAARHSVTSGFAQGRVKPEGS